MCLNEGLGLEEEVFRYRFVSRGSRKVMYLSPRGQLVAALVKSMTH